MEIKNKNIFFELYFRKSLLVVFQVAMIVSAFILAFELRFNFIIPQSYWIALISFLPAIIAIKICVFWFSGLSSGWWRYVSIPDLQLIFKANLIGSSLFVIYIFLFAHPPYPPRSVLILDGILCFLILSGIRVLTRIVRESQILNLKKTRMKKKRVVIIGSGAVGQTIVKEIRQNPYLDKEVIGFLDNDPNRRGRLFHGLPVLGMTVDLEKICRHKNIDLVIVAHPAIRSKELRSILEVCSKAQVQSKILPTMGNIINGEVSIQHIRDVQLEDLLGRKPVRLDIKEIREYLKGKRILVTGAAGSIGSEICRQVSSFLPESVILLDHAETPLFHIENELESRFPKLKYFLRLNDIRNANEIKAIFQQFEPEVVFHAAAYKHVPLSEKNVIEVINNNVQGTRNLADCAHEFGTKHFVMVSTDKAVNPTNVMGASKRAAEIYVQSLGKTSSTNFVTVRFGNVLGSNGSVVPTFKEQVKKGGPITVTHPEVTRFFMTIPEAVQLVLQAGSMGHGGEIFILDMGKPTKIVTLAEELIRLSGLVPYEDIDIVFTGLRPGEKLYEELLGAGEGVLATSHEKIQVVRSALGNAAVLNLHFENIERVVEKMDRDGALKVLKELIPEYRWNPETKNVVPVAKPVFAPPKGGVTYVKV